MSQSDLTKDELRSLIEVLNRLEDSLRGTVA